MVVIDMSATKTILILSANPKDSARLRIGEEVREIEDGLGRSKCQQPFLIRSRWAVRLRDLRRAMLDYEPQIVHFCGHGQVDGLVVEDENGTALLVDPDAFAGLFELFKTKVECVLLNACYSESQADAISNHIPYVIGMHKGITDKAALEFAVGFYDAIGSGRSIEEAFKFGCNALQFYHLPEHLIPVLKKKIENSTQSTEQSSEIQDSKERGLDSTLSEKIEPRKEKIDQKGGFYFENVRGDIHITSEGDVVGGDKIETTKQA